MPAQGSGQIPQEVEDAIYAAPVGELSSPVQTDSGVFLFSVRTRGVVPLSRDPGFDPPTAREAEGRCHPGGGGRLPAGGHDQSRSALRHVRHEQGRGRPARWPDLPVDHLADRRSVDRHGLGADGSIVTNRQYTLSIMGRPRVVVVGLGPAGSELIDRATSEALATIRPLFLRTRRHPAAAELADADSFDPCTSTRTCSRRSTRRSSMSSSPRPSSTARCCTRCRGRRS